MKNNNNITTIYHDRHDHLKLLAGSPAKAEFLSKCIYWWQISKYKIKNSDCIWFTRTTDELAAGSGLSDSSVGRYLRDFAAKGLIEKKVMKRYSKKHAQDIACLHIRITDKLLSFLKITAKNQWRTPDKVRDNKQSDSKNLRHIDDTPSVNLTVSISSNKENNLNNNIVNNIVISNNVNCVEKQKTSFTKTIFPIEKVIGERVCDELKNKIKGMLHNVLKPQQQELKNNERLFTEVLFTVTNKEQVKDVSCVNHRINIAAKLIRKKQWKTPKGFYNHWDVGQAYKEREEVKLRKIQQEKLERELLGVTNPQLILEIKARFEQSMEEENRFDKKKEIVAEPKKHNPEHTHQRHLIGKLKEISNEIYTQEKYLKQMEEGLQKGLQHVSQELIDSIGIKLAKLYDEQGRIEDELKNLRKKWYLCA